MFRWLRNYFTARRMQREYDIRSSIRDVVATVEYETTVKDAFTGTVLKTHAHVLVFSRNGHGHRTFLIHSTNMEQAEQHEIMALHVSQWVYHGTIPDCAHYVSPPAGGNRRRGLTVYDGGAA